MSDPSSRTPPQDPPYDPRLWLEEIDGAQALAWVEARNAATRAALDGHRGKADREAVLQILIAEDRIPGVARRGAHLYNFWTDALHKRGLWRRTTLASYRTDAPEWDVLLDLDALCAAEGESWVWRGCETLAPAHERGLVMLSRGGADAIVLREFDLGTRRFVEDGFVTVEAKTGVAWQDADTLLLATAHGAVGATASGYARVVRRWRRGTPQDAAEPIFEVEPSDMAVWVEHDHRAGRAIVVRQIDFWTTETHVLPDGGAAIRLDVPNDARSALCGDTLTVLLRSDWLDHGEGALLVISFAAFLAGDRAFAVLYAPAARSSLKDWLTFDDHVVLNVLDDLRGRVLLADAAEGWVPRAIPGIVADATVSVGRLSADHATDEITVWSDDFLTPRTLAFGLRDAAPEVVKRGPPRFDATGLVATRHDAIADDGTRIPYFQVGRPDAAGAFTRLNAYGGFDVSMLPGYMPIVGKLWLEEGHVFVMACLRGGGEFGPDWHRAGRREGKRAAQDDLAAVAKDLIRRGVTIPARLSAEGGSNGGLLVGNMLTRHPDLFGAILCQIPLLDMYRYTKLLAGASWIAEYGDPEKPEDWAFMKLASPYHLIEPGRTYPPVLFMTTRRDDRVHPGHARKMAAALQEIGADALFFEQAEGGHGSGADDAQRADSIALQIAFIRRALGVT